MSAAQRALEARLAEIMPLFQEARDALTAIYPAAARLHGVDLSLADRMDAVGAKDWRAALEAEIAQEVEPVACLIPILSQAADCKVNGKFYQFHYGAHHKAEILFFTAPQAVNAELLAALAALVNNANGDAATGYFDVPVSSVINARAAIQKAEGAKQ